MNEFIYEVVPSTGLVITLCIALSFTIVSVLGVLGYGRRWLKFSEGLVAGFVFLALLSGITSIVVSVALATAPVRELSSTMHTSFAEAVEDTYGVIVTSEQASALFECADYATPDIGMVELCGSTWVAMDSEIAPVSLAWVGDAWQLGTTTSGLNGFEELPHS